MLSAAPPPRQPEVAKVVDIRHATASTDIGPMPALTFQFTMDDGTETWPISVVLPPSKMLELIAAVATEGRHAVEGAVQDWKNGS